MDTVNALGCKGVVEMLEKKCQGWIRLEPSERGMMLIPVKRAAHVEQLNMVDEYYAERERKKKRRQRRQNFTWHYPSNLMLII